MWPQIPGYLFTPGKMSNARMFENHWIQTLNNVLYFKRVILSVELKSSEK